MGENVLLDISQAVDRTAIRDDGTVMTLTTTCGFIFNPLTATCFGPAQNMAMQGINLKDYTYANEFSDMELNHMAGMAMSVPVIGSVMWLAVRALRTPGL